MTDLDIEGALRIVAQHVLARAAEDAEWDMYPDIGEYDWAEIAELLTEKLAPYPARFDEAYAFLAKRTGAVDA